MAIPQLSIISPVYDEELVLARFANELSKSLRGFEYEMIFVDDGSKDKSLDIIKDLAALDKRIKYLSFAENLGQEQAILSGLYFSRGDATVVLDSDLQDPPKLIPRMIEAWQKGAKIVFAKRRSRDDTVFKQLSANLFYRSFNLFTGQKLRPDFGEFYLADRKVLKEMLSSQSCHLFPRGWLQSCGRDIAEVAYNRSARKLGKGNYDLFRMLKLAQDAYLSSKDTNLKPFKPPAIVEANLGVKKRSVAIIGGGICGLVTGYCLAKEGFRVSIFEKEKQLGGLLRLTDLAGAQIEQFYHHFFKNDRDLLDLLAELGLHSKIMWQESSVSFVKAGRFHPFSRPKDILGLKILSLSSRLRFVLGTIVLSYWPVKINSRNTAKTVINKFMGQEVWRKIWRPLFIGKFGPFANKIFARWFVARLKSRAGTRERGIEKLGYLKGGSSVLLEELVNRIKQMDGKIYLGTNASRSGKDKSLEVNGVNYDVVVDTCGQASTRCLGIICLIFTSKKKTTDFYWNNILDQKSPFTVLVEHTNLVDKNAYRNKHIVYLGRYLATDSPLYAKSDNEIKTIFLDYLSKIAPIDQSDITSVSVFRADRAQPVILAGFEPPALNSDIPGLFQTSLSHIFPDDRGINQAVIQAHKLKRAVLEYVNKDYD